jgi:hypothetical protein
VLKEVGDEDSVEVRGWKVRVLDTRKDSLNTRVAEFGMVNGVDNPAFCCGDRVDEFAAAPRRVEHPGRRAHPAVHVGRDLVPDRLSAGLVDIAKAILV